MCHEWSARSASRSTPKATMRNCFQGPLRMLTQRCKRILANRCRETATSASSPSMSATPASTRGDWKAPLAESNTSLENRPQAAEDDLVDGLGDFVDGATSTIATYTAAAQRERFRRIGEGVPLRERSHARRFGVGALPLEPHLVLAGVVIAGVVDEARKLVRVEAAGARSGVAPSWGVGESARQVLLADHLRLAGHDMPRLRAMTRWKRAPMTMNKLMNIIFVTRRDSMTAT